MLDRLAREAHGHTPIPGRLPYNDQVLREEGCVAPRATPASLEEGFPATVQRAILALG
jgi:hypothetical protein